jgi:hypothetical protein
MNIIVERKDLTDTRTIGTLTMASFSCFTLEDAVRAEKIYGKTAIPAGTYEVVISFSNRFQKMLPLLLKVPNFEGIRIHAGNKSEDTEGCLLLGMNRTTDTVTESRKAMSLFMPQLMFYLKREKVFLEVG